MSDVFMGQSLWSDPPRQNISFNADDRKQSTYVLGLPGAGKSEVLKVLIQHELVAGHAVVVVDAHSDICDQIIHWPEFEPQHQRRVIMVAPTFFEGMTPTVNLLQAPKGATSRTKEILANRLSQIIGEICLGAGASTVTTRMLMVAKCTARVLLDFENATLQDLADFLGENPPLHFVRAGMAIDDRGVRDFFTTDWNSHEYTASKSAMRVRLKSLLAMSDFYAMTCGPNTVPFYDWLDDGGSMLFSLGAAGTETTQLIGRMVTSMMTAYGDMRKNTGRTDRKPVHFFLDECHHFVGPATQSLLTDMRKYGIHLTLAHQYATQIPRDDLMAHLNATRIKIIGATTYSPVITDILDCERETVMDLPNHHFLIKWGSRALKKVHIRSDLTDEKHRMSKLAYMALRLNQKRFYRPLDGSRYSDPETPINAVPRGLSRELD